MLKELSKALAELQEYYPDMVAESEESNAIAFVARRIENALELLEKDSDIPDPYINAIAAR